jgi:hypothetical protein
MDIIRHLHWASVLCSVTEAKGFHTTDGSFLSTVEKNNVALEEIQTDDGASQEATDLRSLR